jgi:hypothetical protein
MNLVLGFPPFCDNCVCLATFVFLLNRNLLTDISSDITAFAYGFTDYDVDSTTLDNALFWHKMGTTFIQSLVNLRLFYRQQLAEKRRNYLLIYIPAVTFG